MPRGCACNGISRPAPLSLRADSAEIARAIRDPRSTLAHAGETASLGAR
jgi:hypothetical protein